jgi:hypothetical protein
MDWYTWLLWVLLILGALLLAWSLWASRSQPPAGPGGIPSDPFAAEVAEFNRMVSDWSRRG